MRAVYSPMLGAATPARASAFGAAFAADLAAALFLPPSTFTVTGLAQGSVIVSADVSSASTAFSANVVRAAALALDSPTFAMVGVLTLAEADRANALSLNGASSSAASPPSGGGVAASGGTVGGAVDAGNVTSTSPTTSTTSVTIGSSSMPANPNDVETAQGQVITGAVVGSVVGAAALACAAFVLRVRNRRAAAAARAPQRPQRSDTDPAAASRRPSAVMSAAAPAQLQLQLQQQLQPQQQAPLSPSQLQQLQHLQHVQQQQQQQQPWTGPSGGQLAPFTGSDPRFGPVAVAGVPHPFSPASQAGPAPIFVVRKPRNAYAPNSAAKV